MTCSQFCLLLSYSFIACNQRTITQSHTHQPTQRQIIFSKCTTHKSTLMAPQHANANNTLPHPSDHKPLQTTCNDGVGGRGAAHQYLCMREHMHVKTISFLITKCAFLFGTIAGMPRNRTESHETKQLTTKSNRTEKQIQSTEPNRFEPQAPSPNRTEPNRSKYETDAKATVHRTEPNRSITVPIRHANDPKRGRSKPSTMCNIQSVASRVQSTTKNERGNVNDATYIANSRRNITIMSRMSPHDIYDQYPRRVAPGNGYCRTKGRQTTNNSNENREC